ncbi:glycosyltransferase [Paenibacillus sp. sptzw28]|uniref:bifunctional glycosyltransferase family 2 protein/class I SAM-dependent methyltransferase n=1 Tax=Paenibacillus sp. sptzw28 TaxID=715179 RepID=UPI001C6F40AE|nr:bifunctional glycosyltransferase family 2 protein/class I SAM-dependent methyltransferase [Paenibacillus sp. sptzw28]QYR19853.1 glycosyltransferase [Paenibacillus sp. sptzw28]
MKTSIILLTYNGLAYTRSCVESIRSYTPPDEYEIIVVDNGSTDGTAGWLKDQTDLKVISNQENLGFPKGCNQGMAAASGENLLLLNNDTIVTPRWLGQLLACLYSDERIGAVGPVTNSAAYYSSLPVPYRSEEEMIAFAEQYNRSDSAKWEERLKLIGFCLLVKREVYEAVGGLDERFSPGNYEDDDFCLRIRRAGYRLKICTDTFIHHEGSASFRNDPQSFNALMQDNVRKFSEKWGFSPDYSLLIRHELLQLLDEPASEPIRVLEVGCACGATLLEIKNWYPNAEVHGIELNPKAAEIASLSANVRSGNIETIEIGTAQSYFDYIIFADVLEHLVEPWNVLHKTLPYLKENGKVLASIPNVAHYSVIRDLLKGHWTYQDRGLLDVTHLRFFTREGICRLFSSAGYPYLEFGRNTLALTQEDEDWMNVMGRIAGDEMKEEWRTYQYIVKAYKKQPDTHTARTQAYELLKTIVRRIEWDIEPEESRAAIADMFRQKTFDETDLADVIAQDVVFPVKTANVIADILIQSGLVASKEELLGKLLMGVQ